MRSYTALLVLENVFDSVDLSDLVIADLCQRIFYPKVEIVEDYCHTLLGEEVDVNYEVEGYIELSTGETITRSRIEELLSLGIYKVRIRSLSTCTSEGGVCAKCYHSSRPDEPYPEVGSTVTVSPVFVKSTEVLTLDFNRELTLSLSPDSYDSVLVYCNQGLQPSSSYVISGTKLSFNDPSVSAGTPVVVRYRSITTVPYMLWLAGTYSGSLLGVRALPGPLLPISPLRLVEGLPEYSLDQLLSALEADDSMAPGNLVEYASSIQDLLEKSLFCVALRTIYNAV
jgi:hypothetical protein